MKKINQHRILILAILVSLCLGLLLGRAFPRPKYSRPKPDGVAWLNGMRLKYNVDLDIWDKYGLYKGKGLVRAVVIDPDGNHHKSRLKKLKGTSYPAASFLFPADFHDAKGQWSRVEKKGFYTFYFLVDGKKVFDDPQKWKFYLEPVKGKPNTKYRPREGIIFQDCR